MSDLVSAHNGYLEVYLDLGLIGLSLIVLILIQGFRRASQAFQHNPEVASLFLAYVTTATFYSITEVGFRLQTPSWIFLLLAVVGASGVTAGLLGDAPRQAPTSHGSTSEGLPGNHRSREKNIEAFALGNPRAPIEDFSAKFTHHGPLLKGR